MLSENERYKRIGHGIRLAENKHLIIGNVFTYEDSIYYDLTGIRFVIFRKSDRFLEELSQGGSMELESKIYI